MPMMDSPRLAAVSRTLDTVAGLVQSYERIDEHVQQLQLKEAACLLQTCLDATVALSQDGNLKSEIQAYCASLRAKCLSEMKRMLPVAFGDFLHAELENHRFQQRLLSSKTEPVGALDCSALYQQLAEEADFDDIGISEEGEQVLYRLKWAYYHRYKILVKVALFLGQRWLSFTNDGCFKGDEQNINLGGKTLSITYREFQTYIELMGISDVYLRLIENRVYRYVMPKVDISGLDDQEQVAEDFVYVHCLGISTNTKVVPKLFIDNYKSSADLVLGVVARILQVDASLQQLLRLSQLGAGGNIHDEPSAQTSLETEKTDHIVDIDTCSSITPVYIRLLVDDLISRLCEVAYACWELECKQPRDILENMRNLCALLNAERTLVDTTSRSIPRFLSCMMRSWEEQVLVFARMCARSQGDDDCVDCISVSDSKVSPGASIRRLDKQSLMDVLEATLSHRFSGTSMTQVFGQLEWTNNIESCGVSNNVYTLAVLLFTLAAQPIALIPEVFGTLGPGMVSTKIITLCLDTYSSVVQSVLTMYLVVTQDCFKQFVLSITKSVSKDEDVKDLGTLNISLRNFMLLLSNVSLLSGTSLILPYFAQSLAEHVDWSYTNMDRKAIQEMIKARVHTCTLHVHLLKFQDYLLTQLSALIQQVLQKLLSRLLNSLNYEAVHFGDDAIHMLTQISSLCEGILPRKLHVVTMCLVLDLYFTTVPDIFLDYLDLLNYQPSDEVLSNVTAFVIQLDDMLSNYATGMGKTNTDFMYHAKFVAFSAVFKNDFSCVDDPNSPYNQRDLNRLCKLCRCIQQRVAVE
ncbi:transcriptional regulator, putative [Babesia ovis]|uniref:Transcriptional regulator, putative n=1 Tax=Babesia ovis TaxID=5869 RepID=A0A9W5TA44_BABOV|nr:transcriptional regulator, putative [Babesia ovis]